MSLADFTLRDASAADLPAINGGHEAWRYTLISGVFPALPLILIRPFLPESPVWQSKREAGTLKRPSIAALFAPELRKTTLLTTIIFASSYGIAFGAIQQLPQILGAQRLAARAQHQLQAQAAPAIQACIRTWASGAAPAPAASDRAGICPVRELRSIG